MFWVGLTGGIASGKSTVAKILETLGIAVVGADQLAHDAIAKGSAGAAEVRAAFGDEVFAEDGSVDRAKLGKVVFADKSHALRHQLEAIIHPQVRKQSEGARTKFEARGDLMAVYEIPLLFEKKLEDHFDLIVTVAVSPQIQIDRLIARSGLNHQDAQDRIASQLSQDLKVHASDFVIWNDGDHRELEKQTKKIVDEILKNERRR